MSAPSRRWPRVRFRLWHLLALVTLLCGWLGYETNRARRIEAVTTAVRSKQGSIQYRQRFNQEPWWNASDADPINALTALMLRVQHPEAPAPEWLLKVMGPYYFVSPTKISLYRHHYADDLLPAICSFTSLKSLAIHCASSKNLELVGNLTQLVNLNLAGEVGDESVPLLGSLKSLELLWIVDTNISKEGANHLRESLPNCHVISEEPKYQLPQAR